MTKPSLAVEPVLETPYQLHSIASIATPAGCEGDWYQYVIEQGKRHITGLRSGQSEAEVDMAVRQMVEGLNDRSVGKNNKKKGKPARS